MKVSTEIDNNFGYEKITQLVDNIPLMHVYICMLSIPFCHLLNRIGGVMVSVLDSSAVYRGFKPRSGQTKDYQLVFVVSALSTQH